MKMSEFQRRRWLEKERDRLIDILLRIEDIKRIKADWRATK